MDPSAAILYSCIARGTTVLVDCAQTYEGNFPEVVSSMLQTLAAHTNFKAVYTAEQSYLFHVIIENGISYICATNASFSKIRANAFIHEIMNRIHSSSLGQRVQYAGENELQRDFSVVLGQEMEHYTNIRGDAENDTLVKLQNQVDDVKNIMIENIDKVLSRGELLEDLMTKTEDLEANVSGMILFPGKIYFSCLSKTFHKTSTQVRRKMWWQNTRAAIVLFLVILVILAVVTVVILKLTNVI